MARAPSRPELRFGLDRLWAPWRTTYVGGHHASPRCIFCVGRLSRSARKKRLILHASPLVLVMLNLFPYNAGHLLVAPRRHCRSIELLKTNELIALAQTLSASVTILKRALSPHGFNLGMNLGRIAGAGFPGHVHWHIVPRWTGDTNFMPAVGATRVISEHLDSAFARLQPLFNRLEPALS